MSTSVANGCNRRSVETGEESSSVEDEGESIRCKLETKKKQGSLISSVLKGREGRKEDDAALL